MSFQKISFSCLAATVALAVAAVALPLAAPAALAQTKERPLKQVPKAGKLPMGNVVYVDDGDCPNGQLKKVVGGSKKRNLRRRTSCVAR